MGKDFVHRVRRQVRLDKDNGWILLIRVVAILILFYKVIGPLLANVLSRFINRYRSKNFHYISFVLDALPYTGTIAKRAWKENLHQPVFKRIPSFLKDVVMYQLYFIPEST